MAYPHSPSPWFIGRASKSNELTTGVYLKNGFCIARCETGNARGKEGMEDYKYAVANARLIATAPDLLKACKQALHALKGREHDQFLRDVIAKATGEYE